MIINYTHHKSKCPLLIVGLAVTHLVSKEVLAVENFNSFLQDILIKVSYWSLILVLLLE